MAHLELVISNLECWYCAVNPATTTRRSYPSGTNRPCCADCHEVGEIMRTLEEVSQTPVSLSNLSELCADILLAPYIVRGGKLDS